MVNHEVKQTGTMTETKRKEKERKEKEMEGNETEGASKKPPLEYPEYPEFEAYLLQTLPEMNPEWTPERIKRAAKLQFETFVDNGWRDGNGKRVQKWKTKTRNVMSYKKPWSFGPAENQSSPTTKPAHDPGPEGWQKAHQELYPDWLVPFEWFHVELWLRDEILNHLNNK